MDLGDVVLLLAAGLAAGAVNAVAGGGSLITYPALLATGLPPVAANVTNAIGVSPGYLGAVLGSRLDLAGQRNRVRGLALAAAAGSALGCVVLLNTPEQVFQAVVPVLVLLASASLAFQDRLRELVGHRLVGSASRGLPMYVVVGVAGFYGGYFGAALGVLLVALLALVLTETLPRISALKNLASAVIGLVTVLVYAVFGPVQWLAVLAIAPTTVIGGYLGARFARKIPSPLWKGTIVGFGVLIGVILLIDAYW